MVLGRQYLRERWDTVNGLKVFSRVSRSDASTPKLPIVLVHGLGVSSRYMTPLAAEFVKRGYRVLAPDLPGHGRSQKPPQVFDIAGLAEALRDWLRVVEIGPALFVGNSMGCQTMTELACLNSSDAAGFAFLGPTMDQYAPSRLSHVGRLFQDQLHEPLSLLPMQALDYIGNGPICTIKTFLHAVEHDMLGRVRGVRIPCLILSGEHDPIAPQVWVEALAKRLPQGSLRIVPGAGHALNYNSAPVIAPEILAFWRAAAIDV